jgi:hypothetical protein
MKLRDAEARIAEHELRLDAYNGNMMDVLGTRTAS